MTWKISSFKSLISCLFCFTTVVTFFLVFLFCTGDSSRALLESFSGELKLKQTIQQELAHTCSSDLCLVYLSCWLHQPYIPPDTRLSLEALLLETGHRPLWRQGSRIELRGHLTERFPTLTNQRIHIYEQNRNRAETKEKRVSVIFHVYPKNQHFSSPKTHQNLLRINSRGPFLKGTTWKWLKPPVNVE